MLNENAKKWVEALRSGKYKQGQGFLKRGGSHCCLGVACELAIESGLSLYVRERQYREEPYTAFDGEDAVLPSAVREWLSLETAAGKNDVTRALCDLNDEGKSFDEIADLIESEPTGLFTAPAAATKRQPTENHQ